MPAPGDPILLDLPAELLGERVLVRPYRAGDGAAVFEAVNESRGSLRPWMPWVESHVTAADSEAFVRRSQASWIARTELVVGIWEREGGRFLGSSGLHCRDWDIPCFEVGYWLRRSAEGRGYVTETVRLLVRFAFETLGANRLYLRCDARNVRSAAVPKRLGFIHEATHRNDSRDPSGSLRDTMIFALTPDDYARLRAVDPSSEAR
ncbi:MAG: GNAT family N-acetyltransferase [Actinomycetota bacterium]